jgi:preprotein translocase SecF subunit
MKIFRFDFVGNLKKYLILSGVLMAIILVGIIAFGVNLDIQFKGGSIITYSYEGDLDTAAFAALVDEKTSSTISLQESESIAAGQKTLIVSLPGEQSLNADEMLAVNEAIQESYPQNNIETLEISNVDPTIGKEFLLKCLLAVVLASILMVVYVAFRFRRIGGLSAGAMAVVALIHDILIVFGVFVLFRIPLNDNFIAVLLTILGYSLNDTIVIYDRVRENERLDRNRTPAEQVNLSVNQSFKRTLITSITTVMAMLIVTLVAYIFNVTSIISFSLPLVVGLASGSYSSICLCGPLWVKWQEHKAKA